MMATDSKIEFYKDILVTAAAGGVSYWATVWRDDTDLDAGRLVIFDREDEESTRYEVTVEDIARGVELVLHDVNRKLRYIPESHRRWIAEGDADDDAGMIDADGADIIVQLAVFGRVIYG